MKVIKRSGRNSVSRLFHAKDDAVAIAAWKLDLNGILHIFNVRSLPPCSDTANIPPLRPSWL